MTIRRFSPEDVRQAAAKLQANLNWRDSPETRAYMAATSLLIEWLGFPWAEREIFLASDTQQFFRFGATSSPTHPMYRHFDRVVALADMLYNLQTVDGIAGRVDKIRDDSVETGVAELEGARIIRQSGYPIRFIPESNVRKVHDLATTVSGVTIACESKCKLETTQLSAKTVKNTLDDARDQLPRDRPGVVFLKIPEVWKTTVESVEQISTGVRSFLSTTGRVSAVITHQEQWGFSSDNVIVVRVPLLGTYHNPRARHSLTRPGGLFPLAVDLGSWTRLTDIVASRPL
jgi:hypothetical protein